MFKKIKDWYYWKFTAKTSGLLPTPRDDRDFETGIFRWFGYTPKNTVKVIKTIGVKNQGPLNTCQWNAATTCKEVDEKVELSVRSLVAQGLKMGLVTGDGFSNLRSGQKVLQDWGIVKQNLCLEGPLVWNTYKDVNTDALKNDAAEHKIKSFWYVTSRNDALKLLDDNRPIVTGLMWYTNFNQGGGFSYPWIIESNGQYQVGGHAVSIIGYIFGYKGISNNKLLVGAGGKNVYIVQNSYGENWGASFEHEGKQYRGIFFWEMNHADNNNYNFYTNLDLSVEESKELIKKNMTNVKLVKDKNSPAVGFFVPAETEAALTSLSKNYGYQLPVTADGKPDWNIINQIGYDGNVELTK
jgi:hypothetical protein